MKKTSIIAEIGINHNGSIDITKKLIDMACLSGFDYVKFQKRNPDICVPEHQKNVIRNTPWGKMTYLEYKHKIEFSKNEYDQIDLYCKEKGIKWFPGYDLYIAETIVVVVGSAMILKACQ